MKFAIFITLCVTLSIDAFAKASYTVAVIEDGENSRLAKQSTTIIRELLALTSREFDVDIQRMVATWTRASIERVVDRAYEDPNVDMVLVTGFIANQVLARRKHYPKPTFLPIVIDTGLFVSRPIGGRSGIKNLNYLSTYADFSTDLDVLSRMVDYKKVVLLVDQELSRSIPVLRKRAFTAATEKNIQLSEIAHDGVNHLLLERLPEDTEALFVAGLSRMPAHAFEQLVNDINLRRIPSYSFAGVADVERGLLMTNSEPKDIVRQAKLNALNMQAVMLGARAEDQPIESQIKDRLTINMATARRIGISPSFDILADATLLNPNVKPTGNELGLADIALLAVKENQELLANRYGVSAGRADVIEARAELLPFLNMSLGNTTRKESPAVKSGVFAEATNDLTLSLNQVIYSDSLSANLIIQTKVQRTRESSLREFKLDLIQAATTAYYRALNAQSQLKVQESNLNISRKNLELAKDRVRLGTSIASDIYRWEAEVAHASIAVASATAQLRQAWESLTRILNQPPGTRLPLREASFNEPFVMTREEFDELIRSQADYSLFSDFYVQRAVRQSPELENLDAQIDAKRRQLQANRRARWLPNFTLGAKLSDNLSQQNGGPATGEGLSDWSINMQATLPLFTGGQTKAAISRSELELQQLLANRIATKSAVEETVRVQLHAAQAKYITIDLAKRAAEASKKNFELISEAYARGKVNVLQLLDAQESSLNAEAAASDSLFDFLITIMALQRAVGGYDFLLPAKDRNALRESFKLTLSSSKG